MSLIAQWTKAWAEHRDQAYIFYSETSSTNDLAKQSSFKKEKIFIAERQTKGRGRGDRKWINSDLMITWGFVLKQAPQPVTVHLMAEALCIALKTVFSPKEGTFIIKKPNDIFIQNKKMAGLLIEVVNKGCLHRLIIGAGMNVFSHPDKDTFSDKASSVSEGRRPLHGLQNNEGITEKQDTLSDKAPSVSEGRSPICLQKNIKKEISKNNWFDFMDEWQKQIKEKIPHCL